jgi:hypothetical protein
MIRFSQIAVPGVLGAALAMGLAGCAERHDRVPADAMLLAEGSGSSGKLAARAPYDGTVYIWDTSSDKMVYEGKVRDGQYVSIDRNHRRIMVGDNVVSEKTFDNDHKFKIYFDRSETSTTIQRRKTIIEEEQPPTVERRKTTIEERVEP